MHVCCNALRTKNSTNKRNNDNTTILSYDGAYPRPQEEEKRLNKVGKTLNFFVANIEYVDEITCYIYRVDQKKCPIRIFCLNLLKVSNFTLLYVFLHENYEPVSSKHFIDTN